MISFHFNIRNPYSERFEIIKCWNGGTSFKHKSWELQIDRTADIVSFDFRITTRQDHAGLYIGLAFVGYEIIFNFYDHRHWNYKEDCWENYDRNL